jgi:ferritin-like metal-binding protein YciE
MPDSNDHFMDWLRDAHAMEEQAEQMLTAMSARIETYPEVKQRLDQHIEETRNQAALIAQCIQRRGGDTSTVKDVTGKAMAMMHSFTAAMSSDEIIKGSLASYAFEHFEIASYKSLIVAAEVAGDTETQRVCQAILVEEEAMAKWLADNMPILVKRFLQHADTPGLSEKR